MQKTKIKNYNNQNKNLNIFDKMFLTNLKFTIIVKNDDKFENKFNNKLDNENDLFYRELRVEMM